MSKIVIFGAGGRAGRAALGEAVHRGHHVTAVVRDPARHGDLRDVVGVRLVRGDVTRTGDVASSTAGQDAVISAAADLNAPFDTFFADAARALLDGLNHSGADRLVVVGLASLLKTQNGERLMDTPGYPQEYRSFCLGHAAGMDVLRANASPASGPDWLVLSPAGDFDHDGTPVGRYRPAPADMASRITYADLATALIDEIETPVHHRIHLGLEGA